ncbi:MAG: hypothetical protein QOE82_1388, partial [Thermoanaerobaculia bacterium]|nr:hypothetical protein [Thermoanaerobaculia bacterium]
PPERRLDRHGLGDTSADDVHQLVMNPAKPIGQFVPSLRADAPLLDQRQPPFDLLDHSETCSNRTGINAEDSHESDCNCPHNTKG